MLHILRRLALYGWAVAGMTWISCKKGSDETSCGKGYKTEIAPIVNNKCAIDGCHNGSTTFLDFRSYQAIKSRVDNGRLYQYLFTLQIMPPQSAAPLTDAEKTAIRCWLDHGAPDN